MTQDRDVAASRDPAGLDPAGPDSAGPDSARPDSAGDESLSDLFWSVARQLRETSQETLAPWDITPAQLRALRVLRRHGQMRLSELSDRLHIAPRSTTEVVDALESRALIQRRPDQADRRATLVELTEHGAGTLDAIRGAEAGQVFGRLSVQDRADLARILRRLRNLSAQLIRGSPRRRRPHSPQAPRLIRATRARTDWVIRPGVGMNASATRWDRRALCYPCCEIKIMFSIICDLTSSY